MKHVRPVSLGLVLILSLLLMFQLSFVESAPNQASTPMPPPPVKPSAGNPSLKGTPTLDTADLPEGWAEFEGEGMTIQLPETFEGGDIKKNLDTIMAVLKSEVPELASAAAILEQNPDLFAFWAFDKKSKGGFLTNVNVVRQPLPAAYPMDLILESTISMLPSTFSVLENEVLQINDIETGRLVMEGEILNAKFKTLQYVMMDESNNMWVISFATSGKEYKDRIEDFEASFATFRLLPGDDA